jgi:hypothetical protein
MCLWCCLKDRWAGFNGIYVIRFGFRMWEILSFKWFLLPLKIQINSKKTLKYSNWGPRLGLVFGTSNVGGFRWGGRGAAVVTFCAHSVLSVFAAESLGFHNFVFASIADLHCFWHHIAQDAYVIVKGRSCSSGLFTPRFLLFFCCGVLATNAMVCLLLLVSIHHSRCFFIWWRSESHWENERNSICVWRSSSICTWH